MSSNVASRILRIVKMHSRITHKELLEELRTSGATVISHNMSETYTTGMACKRLKNTAFEEITCGIASEVYQGTFIQTRYLLE